MKSSTTTFGLLRIPLDILAVCAALLLSYRLREFNVDLLPNIQLLESATTLPSFEYYFRTFVVPGTALFVILTAALGHYVLKRSRGAWQEVGRVIIAGLLWIAIVMTWFFLVRKQLFYSRILLIHATTLVIVFVTAARVALIVLQRALMRHGIGVAQVVSVGSQRLPKAAKEAIKYEQQYQHIGHCESLQELDELRMTKTIDLVLQTDPTPDGKDTAKLIDYCRSLHIAYAFLPPVFADVPHLLTVQRLGTMPMLQFKPTPLDGWGRVIKRLFDIVASLILIAVLSPILIIAALVILITSGWPILYVSRRVGLFGNTTIPVLKFRTMVKNADAMKAKLMDQNEREGPLFKIKNDPRITRVGRWLRRFDIDEFPQLFNVLIGHMSLVGPRPHLPAEVDRYTQYQRRVFAIKPGMTGLAQVSGRSELNFQDEVRLDLRYIEEWSLFKDLWILWRTVFEIFHNRGG